MSGIEAKAKQQYKVAFEQTQTQNSQVNQIVKFSLVKKFCEKEACQKEERKLTHIGVRNSSVHFATNQGKSNQSLDRNSGWTVMVFHVVHFILECLLAYISVYVFAYHVIHFIFEYLFAYMAALIVTNLLGLKHIFLYTYV